MVDNIIRGGKGIMTDIGKHMFLLPYKKQNIPY